MGSFVASRPRFDREAADDLLALFDPVHFSSRNRLAPTTPRVLHRPRSRTPSIASVRSTVTLSQLLISTPRPSTPTSTRSSSASLPPFLSLPPELLLHILALALPPPSDTRRASVAERNSLLAALARVHSSLRGFAQSELFRHVTLHTDEGVDALLRLAVDSQKGGRAAALVGQVKTLRMVASFESGDGGRSLAELVQRLGGLESLHLEGLDGIEMRQFVLHPHLKHLTATRCGFRSRFRLSTYARPSPLTSLSLTHSTAHDDALTGFSLPHLSRLRVHSVHLPPPSALAVLEPSCAFERLGREVARQLESLKTDEQHFGFFFPLSASSSKTAIKLTHLRLIKLSHLSPLLDALPPSASSSLKILHLSPPASFLPSQTSPDKRLAHFSSLLAPFRASSPLLPAPLRGMETLVLDGRYQRWRDAPAEEADGAQEDVKELLERVEKAGGGRVEVRFEEGAAGEEEGGLTRRARGASESAGAGGRRRGSSMGALLMGGSGTTVRAGGRYAAGDW
ncbi:hypothetical protein JCM6882_009014 [Rhodosporidiobolus microsporus]